MNLLPPPPPNERCFLSMPIPVAVPARFPAAPFPGHLIPDSGGRFDDEEWACSAAGGGEWRDGPFNRLTAKAACHRSGVAGRAGGGDLEGRVGLSIGFQPRFSLQSPIVSPACLHPCPSTIPRLPSSPA